MTRAAHFRAWVAEVKVMGILRKALEQITKSGVMPIAKLPTAIERLRKHEPHSIQLVKETHPFPFNCFAYALGMADSDAVHDVLLHALQQKADVKFGAAFLSRLIERGILVKDKQRRVLLYYDGATLKRGPEPCQRTDHEITTSTSCCRNTLSDQGI
jgi:hypothetical protein